jgi:hypothetical protein
LHNLFYQDKKIKSDITEIEKDNKEVETAFSEESFWEQAKDYGFYTMIGVICIGIVMVIFLFKKSKKISSLGKRKST